jgi:outer membrane receptor for ferrienterochelin and colicins
MQKSILSLLICLLLGLSAFAQEKSLRGRVVDAETDEGLPGVNILIKGTNKGVATDANGNFAITGFPDGAFTLEFSIVGYASISKTINGATATEIGEIRLFPSYILGQEIVISGTRKSEKITETPATIQIINSKDISELPSFNPGELLSRVKGVEFVRSGVIGTGVNIRGFNSNFNAKNLQVNDGMFSTLIATGLPMGPLSTFIK